MGGGGDSDGMKKEDGEGWGDGRGEGVGCGESRRVDTKGAGSGLYNRRVLGCITAGFGIEAQKNRKNHRKKNKAHTTGSYNRLCGDQELGLDNARLRRGPGGVYWRKVYMGREDERVGGGEDGREGCPMRVPCASYTPCAFFAFSPSGRCAMA